MPYFKPYEGGENLKGLTRSNIDWTMFGWPVLSGCERLCSIDGEIYCYGYKMVTAGRLKGHRWYNSDFSPKFNRDVLEAPLNRQKPATIFIAPLGEVWGPWVPREWQHDIMSIVKRAPQHTFLNLSKYSVSVGQTNWGRPDNIWFGVSVTTEKDAIHLERLRQLDHPNKFASFEPLLEDITSSKYFTLEGIDWVIIGALSKGAVKVQPDPGHFFRLYSAARRAGIPVFIKDNCTILTNPPKEFPEGFPK